ncbi:DUF3329 domain-containing protein [Oceaniovalibus sp. ACAM 378]|jgi:hypothetical protein|uniref:DUF3329 domain-containing protein n=1 Tax=Oceaniovalibus sp. ACAM 378 TaxID=2599923 RepID=UPI0011D3B93E|nr:DUF3329 domain-containing protein [Oceaniovalibus sp. ACAM 378]TYB89256.1 DUF3329 domain-containing protein [Oceaniovalibus sp. ACAM 378]
MFNFDHPFYRPLWRRIAITGFCLVWAVFEFAQGAPVWAMIFAGLGALTGYHFFVAKKGD